ncbi:unnamed protein product [Closterium sp. Yama58-4]|nr:unnamed protein product [Closterium sp. Yama58-4]
MANLVILVSSLLLLAALPTPTRSHGSGEPQITPPGASRDADASMYIVRLRSAPPLAAYRGEIAGYPAIVATSSGDDPGDGDGEDDSWAALQRSVGATTGSGNSRSEADSSSGNPTLENPGSLKEASGNPAAGRARMSMRAPHVRAYAEMLARMQAEVASEVELDAKLMNQPSLLSPSTPRTNQLQARHQRIRRAALPRAARHPAVASARPSRPLRPDTIDSPAFLGLAERSGAQNRANHGSGGMWRALGGQQRAGEGMVVGVIDSGIWPEHPSFSDRNFSASRPNGWSGSCDATSDFRCNNKIIGARIFNAAFRAKHRKPDLTTDWLSPRDGFGHGTWCAGLPSTYHARPLPSPIPTPLHPYPPTLTLTVPPAPHHTRPLLYPPSLLPALLPTSSTHPPPSFIHPPPPPSSILPPSFIHPPPLLHPSSPPPSSTPPLPPSTPPLPPSITPPSPIHPPPFPHPSPPLPPSIPPPSHIHPPHPPSIPLHSAAAGNSGVPMAGGRASGMAPAARLAAYKVFWYSRGDRPEFRALGGESADLLAAVNQAVADGVHVLSISLSADDPETTYFDDVAYMNANLAVADGVHVLPISLSADDPDATYFDDVAYMKANLAGVAVLVLPGRNSHRVRASAVLPHQIPPPHTLPSVPAGGGNGGDAGVTVVMSAGNNGAPLSNPLGTYRTITNFSPFYLTVGASSITRGGVSLASSPASDEEHRSSEAETDNQLEAETHQNTSAAIATVGADSTDSTTASSSSAESPPQPASSITVAPSSATALAPPAPVVAAFSSSGPLHRPWSRPPPGHATNSLLKPDVIGPGVDLWAAWVGTVPGKAGGRGGRGGEALQMSGTSMATPHLAGIAALIMQKYPKWSPAQVMSAIMTTAITRNTKGRRILNDRGVAATPWEMGSGHVFPRRALNPGLTYDARRWAYVNFLAGQDYRAAKKEFPGTKIYRKKAWNFNLPTISVARLKGTVDVFRTVVSVASLSCTYKARVTEPPGVRIMVQPGHFTIYPGKAVTSAAPSKNVPVKKQLRSEDGIFGTSGGFGFTKANELFVGRVAMLGFAASLLGEAVTGQGILSQLNLETGIPITEAEPLLLFFIAFTVLGAIGGLGDRGRFVDDEPVGPPVKPGSFKAALGLSEDGPLFGFTKANELFVGRMAQLGFAASLIGEVVTGRGALAQLNIETGLPVWELEPLLLASIAFFFVAAINPGTGKFINDEE